MEHLALSLAGRLPQQGEAQALEKVTNQLEGSFLELLYRQARDPLPMGDDGDDLFAESPSMRQYTELMHAALIEHSAGGLGLGKTIAEHIEARGLGGQEA